MSDRELLDDLITKLRQMQEQLSMAQLETTAQTLLASRIRHLAMLAVYVRERLEERRDAPPSRPAGDDLENRGDTQGGG